MSGSTPTVNPFVGFEPLDPSTILQVLGHDYLPTFVVFLLALLASIRERWVSRDGSCHRTSPLGPKLEIRRLHYWSLPIYAWAFETSFATLRLHFLSQAHGISIPFFLHVFMYRAGFALFLLVTLQLLAVMLVERESFGLGLRGHRRVAAVYALISVVLDAFFLLAISQPRWPR